MLFPENHKMKAPSMILSGSALAAASMACFSQTSGAPPLPLSDSSLRLTSTQIKESVLIFSDARPLLGTEIITKGLLRWTFENKNLFPVGTDPNHPSELYCLPVLIKRSDKILIKRAEKFDSSIVSIKGRIINPAPPGEIGLGTCKEIGIEVESIEPAT